VLGHEFEENKSSDKLSYYAGTRGVHKIWITRTIT